MGFGEISNDALILAMYIALTIVLILVGKLMGKVAYSLYWSIDPKSYTNSVPREECSMNPTAKEMQCVPKSQAQIDQEAREMAEADGRFVGAWIGFLIGGVLSVFKAYNIYVKVRGSV
jgi:hypothetical protein